jgi:acetyl esterase/lipase
MDREAAAAGAIAVALMAPTWPIRALALLGAGALAGVVGARTEAQPIGAFGPYEVASGAVLRYAAPATDIMIECKPQPRASQWAGPFPAIVLVHGGGWSSGTNAIGPPYSGYSGAWCRLWASWGFHAFSVAYRLTGEAAWPAALEDVQAAIRHIRAHAASLDVNPNYIGGEGDSAGGSLVEQAGMTHRIVAGDLAEYLPDVDPMLQFIVPSFGPWSWGPSSPDAPLPAMMATSEEWRARRVADAIFIQGARDSIVAPSQSAHAYCVLKAAGARVHYLSYPGGHEFTEMAGPAWSRIVGTIQTRAIALAIAFGQHPPGGGAPAIPAAFAAPPVLSTEEPDAPAC